ncbi:MAG: CRTAC1 family protein [Chloroflexota bacterium]
MRSPILTSLAAALCLALVAPDAALAAQASKGQPRVPTFVEEAASAGVEHTYDGGFEFYVGGGVAVFDCDGDGRPELFFAGGEVPAALYRNRSRKGKRLRFERLESEVTDLTAVTGAYPLDIDSDGNGDLVVLRHGENVLLRGLGSCTFERANEEWGFDGGNDWTTAFSATWQDGRAWPTLAFGNYVDHFDEQHLAHCAPGALYPPAAGDRGFAPATALEPGRCALSLLFSDWDRSGRRDLRVSNDRHYYYNEGGEQLWQIPLDGPPRLYTAQDGWQPVRIFGMGIGTADVTGDGYPEYYLANIGSNRLETLASGRSVPVFEDIAYDHGISATTPWIGKPVDPSTSWHPEFDDVNNDGRLDLYISKGNVDAAGDSALKDPNELFLGLADGTFRRAAKQAGIRSPIRTRGAALVDLNQDGLLDLVEVNRYENVSLRRNLGAGTARKPKAMGRWLEVRPTQSGVNPDAVGAWIEVRAGEQLTTREVTVGGGHAGGALGPVHFGLGQQETAEVRVTWPDGEVGEWRAVDADQVVTVERETVSAPGSRGAETG